MIKNIFSKEYYESNPKRILYLDQLRDIAIISVIIVHVAESFMKLDIGTFNWFVGDVWGMLIRFAVPLFLMISGSLLLNREYGYETFIKKRYPRVLTPFIFWAIIYVLFALFVQGKFFTLETIPNMIIFGFKMFFGLQGYLVHFWFIWLILLVYAFAPIINKWVQKVNLREIEYFLGLWIIIMVLASFSIPFYNLEFHVVGAFGFFILGYYLRNKKNEILDNIWLWSILFIIVTIIRVILSYNFSIETGKNIHFEIYNIMTVVQATSIFLIVKNFNSKQKFDKISSFFKNGIIGKLTVSLSKYSFGIYLIHILILRTLAEFGMKLSTRDPLIWIPLVTVVVLIISWGLLAILNRIPIIRMFTGEH